MIREIVSTAIMVISLIVMCTFVYQTSKVFDEQMRGMSEEIAILKKAPEFSNQAMLTAEEKRQKINDEYADKKVQLEQAISGHDIFNSIIPDDVIRMFQEETCRTDNVPAAPNSP